MSDPIKSSDEYIALDMQNNTSVAITGTRIEVTLLVQKPRNGLSINWPSGLAATTRLKKFLLAVGSSCEDDL